MDLSLSDKHRALQAEVREFARQHGHKSPKLGGGRKRPDQKSLDWQKLLLEHGYVGRTIPREYGGFGAEPDVLESAVIAAEFASAGMYAGLTNQGISMLVPTLLEVGTDEQRKRAGRSSICRTPRYGAEQGPRSGGPRKRSAPRKGRASRLCN